MKILDTNLILRFLLRDNEEMAEKAEKIISEGNILLTNEVAAEAIYVLTGVYKTDRQAASNALLEFIEINGVNAAEYGVLSKSLNLFAKNNLDFVDCLLCAYNLQYGYDVCTFDVKLAKLIKKFREA